MNDGSGVTGWLGCDEADADGVAEAEADGVEEADADGLDWLGVGVGLDGGALVGGGVGVTQIGGVTVVLADAEVPSSAGAWLELSLGVATSVAFAVTLAVALSVVEGHAGGAAASSCIACAGMESKAPTATVPVATAPSSDIAGRRGFLMRR
jgi:hypothetical protein